MHSHKCKCRICSPATWQNLNCNSLQFTSSDDSVDINKTADCTFDFTVDVASAPIITADTDSVTLSGDGSATFLSADVNISEEVGNVLVINADGLFVPSSVVGVTSVGLTMPTGFSVANSPITSSGTLAVTTVLSGIIQASGGAFSAITVSSPLTFLAGALGIQQATGAQSGYLSNTDWTIFNSKEAVLTFSTGLTRTVNTVTNNLSTGVVGGQSAVGGTASGNNLTLSSTTNATKGKILFGTSAYDEVNNRLGIGTATPTALVHISDVITSSLRMSANNVIVDLLSNTSSQLLFGNGGYIRTSISNFLIEQPSLMGPIGSYNWIRFYNPNNNQISGAGIGIVLDNTFNPISGTATFASFGITETINQTGGANGITRGIYINPSLTSAPDYRALEIANTSGKGIYQTGGSASNYFAGLTVLGSAITPLARLHITDNIIDPVPRSTIIYDITWNTVANVTGLLMNVALTGAGAGVSSKLVDIQQAGVSKFWVDVNAGSLQVSTGGIRIGSVGGSGYGGISLAGGTIIPQTIHSGDALSFTIAGVPAQTIYTFSTPVNAPTSGDWYSLQFKTPVTGEFDPVSGTANYTVLYIDTIYNQTGTATGITRGIHLNPAITAVADYRAIEISNNQNWAIYQSGALAKSLFAGTLRFTGLPTYADDTAAGVGGLITGDIYQTATGELRIKL